MIGYNRVMIGWDVLNDCKSYKYSVSQSLGKSFWSYSSS